MTIESEGMMLLIQKKNSMISQHQKEILHQKIAISSLYRKIATLTEKNEQLSKDIADINKCHTLEIDNLHEWWKVNGGDNV